MEKHGEYLLGIELHDIGYTGKIRTGVVEAGYVDPGEITNYYYNFQVLQTQTITFTTELNIIFGDANIYIKKCENNEKCLSKDF